MDLQPIEPTDVRFADWCEVWAACQRLDRPGEPERPAREHLALGRQLVSPGGSRDGTHRAAVIHGHVVGALRLILPTQDNLALAVVDVAVHPTHRRRGVGSTLLAEGVRLAAESGRSELISDVDEPVPGTAGRLFAERHGWECNLHETRRDLPLPFDDDRVAVLEAEATSAAADYDVVRWRDRTPEMLVDDRAGLERRMTADAPHGDLPVEEEHWDAGRIREYEQAHLERGRTVLSAGAVRDGRLVAFTDLQVPLDDPRLAHQGGTLVLREHRGHRLGVLVKIAVLRDLLASGLGVQRIRTYNAESNGPMVAVNEALGFLPAGQLTTWARRLDTP